MNRQTYRTLLMIALAYAVVALSMLTIPSSSGAVELVNPDGTRAEPFQTWADSSRAPLPPATIRVSTDSKETALACGSASRSCVAEAPSEFRAWFGGIPSRRVTLHEVGHVFDGTMPDWKRRVFARITRETRTWRDPVHEQFAVAYSDCAMGVASTSGEYGYRVPRNIRLRVCRLLRQ